MSFATKASVDRLIDQVHGKNRPRVMITFVLSQNPEFFALYETAEMESQYTKRTAQEIINLHVWGNGNVKMTRYETLDALEQYLAHAVARYPEACKMAGTVEHFTVLKDDRFSS